MITKINFEDRTIKSYAIRKFTPFECFRLMGVRDDVIKAMQSNNARAAEIVPEYKGMGKPEDMAISASQQYKMAGNSIVVDVLAAIYEQLWFPKATKAKGVQLSLFEEETLPDTPVEADSANKEKVFLTLFSGYDSQLMAADVLRKRHPEFKWTCAGWSDIDKYACMMHNLVFPQYADKALGDITKIDWRKVKNTLAGRQIVDMLTYSSPCQDISQCGKQMGLKEGSGTRSALLWNVVDAIEVLRPKYLLQENVAALVSKKFMPDFQRWLDKLSSLGYVSKWARLNARYYVVPQNRDRVFCLSMRKEVAFNYQFPEPIALQRRLEDVLEEEVADRYFLKDDAVGKFLEANNSDNALFVQFDLPPTHEEAMFLKTWLTMWMQSADGWEMTSVSLQRAICSAKQEMELSYSVFKDKGVAALGEEFERLFSKNMERKNDGV